VVYIVKTMNNSINNMDPIKCALTELTGTVFCVWTDCGSMS